MRHVSSPSTLRQNGVRRVVCDLPEHHVIASEACGYFYQICSAIRFRTDDWQQ
jgi:hypothetical protein